MGDNHNEAHRTLADLQENCLTRVLEFTTPKDVCRLSVFCHTLESAANSNCVWEKMVPSHYRDLLARANRPLQYNSKKELYFKLCEQVSIDNGTKKFWLDKATGKVCFLLHPRDLDITRGNANHDWRWICQDGSRFHFISREGSGSEAIAQFMTICRFEVQGVFDCKFLSPGTEYTVSFKLKLVGSSSFGWDKKPVKFSVTTSWGHQQQSALFLQNTEKPVDNEKYQKTSVRHVREGWMELDAGEFSVEENKDGPKEVKFHMNEVDDENCKGGLLLGGVKIQPSFLVTERLNVGEEWSWV
ncbi:hypothetical protein SUGI_0491490 [Cryptomeria japonica]|uniref:F-box protein At2g02240-like n=1 Tax=Cryptomeria japonica TaxID=3369 RepID=UPI002408ECFD|nr:F-box protein At2g02240-like [Cryptomeria japonica]GLJ25659.1 hypothetical protein SUGI_0491490 [Cryptomeria japonica]